ncbi:MAG TPA: HAMP domain-containing sensor histidine kinase [Candidatus Brocadiia bacterium]|nr:HAMP domain-containing sensor histidine kinase [Candidatus Brocadiia bacterium]
MADDAEKRTETAEMDHLVRELTHEIRNPLNALGIHLRLLSEDARRLPPEQSGGMLDRLDILQRQAFQLKELLDDFLRYASRTTPRLEPSDPRDAVMEVLDFVEPEALENNVCVETDWQAGALTIPLDKGLFKQAVLNIIMNAFKAMPEGGKLKIGVVTRDGIFLLSISDTGRGMPPECAERLFEPSFSASPGGGSGLGLAITSRIVREHGGRIEVASEPGKGTCFTISLPIGT